MGATTAGMPCTIGARELLVLPLTVKKIDELDNWIRVQFLRSIREAADGDQIMIATGMHEMMGYSFFTRRGSKFLASVQGIAKLVSLSTGLDYDKSRELITLDVDLTAFHDTFSFLNGLKAKLKSGGEDSPDPKMEAG